jgi:hypothetical protein
MSAKIGGVALARSGTRRRIGQLLTAAGAAVANLHMPADDVGRVWGAVGAAALQTR